MTDRRFISPLASDLAAFLAYRRQVNRQYLSPPEPLYRFDRFVADHCRRGPVKLEEVIPMWLARPGQRAPSTVQGDFTYVRQFCMFLRRRDPTSYVPGTDLVPPYRHLFKPHIYSPDEVRRLLREARAAQDCLRCRGFRAIMLETFLLVLYCTGLRPGEAVRLRVEDVDLREHAFLIRESKGKSRWVPFDYRLARRLTRYLEYRRRIAPAEETHFFLRPTGRPYGRSGFQCWFRLALRRAGIVATGRRRPRLYDFRHTFAVERLTRWYRQRVNFSDRLPWLSTYMGHRDLMGTEVYLQATPELLQLASRRFARRFRSRETP
jgi:integrase